jgi:hypothetical protein
MMPLKGAASVIIAVFGAVPCWGETVEEELPLLPGSEQFKLQHSRAIETSGLLLADCAFLQQSGMFVIEPSPSCAPAPTAPPSMAAMRVKAVNHFRIAGTEYKSGTFGCQAVDDHSANSTRLPSGYHDHLRWKIHLVMRKKLADCILNLLSH